LYTSDDVILFRAFPTSLKVLTLSWFTYLPPNSIYYFETLVTRFGVQFATKRPHHLTSLALVNIQQEKDESLWVFMEHFDKVTLNIRNLKPDVTLHHLIIMLMMRLWLFVNNLCKKFVTNMDMVQTKLLNLCKWKMWENSEMLL